MDAHTDFSPKLRSLKDILHEDYGLFARCACLSPLLFRLHNLTLAVVSSPAVIFLSSVV